MLEGRARQAWVIAALALSARLFYLGLDFPVPPQDTPDYDEIALNLLAGEGFVSRETWFGHEMRSWRAPFYPFFLAGVYGVFGYDHDAVKLVQAVVGALAAVLVFALGRRLHPPSALWAGSAAALYGPLVGSAGEVMTETWFVFFLLLGSLLLYDTSRGAVLLSGGVVVGLAALTRPVGLLLLAAYGLATFLSAGPAGWRRVLWVLAGVLLVLAPWTGRNWAVHGALVPISTHGGFILARSNAAEPDWRRDDGWGIEAAVFERMPTELERDRHWRRQALEFVAANPGTYLRLAGERFMRLWYFMRPEYNFWFVGIMPWCLAGLYLHRRDPAYRLVGLFCGLSVAVFSLVLYGSVRFRLPLEPFFLLFGAAAAYAATVRWGGRLTGGLLAVSAGLNWGLYLWSAPLHAWVVHLLRAGGLKE